jgi:hypothetical protein
MEDFMFAIIPAFNEEARIDVTSEKIRTYW